MQNTHSSLYCLCIRTTPEELSSQSPPSDGYARVVTVFVSACCVRKGYKRKRSKNKLNRNWCLFSNSFDDATDSNFARLCFFFSYFVNWTWETKQLFSWETWCSFAKKKRNLEAHQNPAAWGFCLKRPNNVVNNVEPTSNPPQRLALSTASPQQKYISIPLWAPR